MFFHNLQLRCQECFRDDKSDILHPTDALFWQKKLKGYSHIPSHQDVPFLKDQSKAAKNISIKSPNCSLVKNAFLVKQNAFSVKQKKKYLKNLKQNVDSLTLFALQFYNMFHQLFHVMQCFRIFLEHEFGFLRSNPILRQKSVEPAVRKILV